jgi:hypothetical protein
MMTIVATTVLQRAAYRGTSRSWLLRMAVSLRGCRG